MSAARIWIFCNSFGFDRTERFVAEFEKDGRRFEGTYSDVINAMLAAPNKSGLLVAIETLTREDADAEMVKSWLRRMSRRLAT